MCENTNGGYICSCAEGYELQSKSKCRALNSSLLVLYFAHDKYIKKLDAQGLNAEVVANTTQASGLDFHYGRNILFWTDTKTKKIYSMLIDNNRQPRLGSLENKEIGIPGSWSPVAVAVDWIGDKLYVADSLGQKIDVFEIDGRWHSIVLGSNLTAPADICLDPTVG